MTDGQYGSVENFILFVAKNYDAIYSKANSHAGLAYDMVVNRPLNKGNSGRLSLRIEKDPGGDFYDVRSAMRTRSDQFKNKQPLWERNGTSAPSAEANPLIPEAQAAEIIVGPPQKANKP